MDIFHLPAHHLRDLLREKKLHTEEVFQLFYERALSDEYSAWINLNNTAKLSGEGVLHGLPIAIEDSIAVTGMPRTYGSLLLKENGVSEDDREVAQLKNAGGVILGKTNLSEFGFADITTNKLQKPTLNPLTKQTCLGGAGGAAVAVATGSAPIAFGQDSTGNLRLSAAACKLFGLKFSKARTPTCTPTFKPPTESRLLSKGVIARHPRDIQMILNCLDMERDSFCNCPPQTPPRALGLFTPVDIPDYHMEQIEWPFDETVYSTISSMLACDRYLPLLALKDLDPNFLDIMDEVSCEWFYLAKDVTGIDYSGALCFVQWVQDAVQILLSRYEFLISAAMPQTPSSSLIGNRTMLFPFNLSGHPALVTPSGHQIIGQYYKERELLEFAEKHFL